MVEKSKQYLSGNGCIFTLRGFHTHKVIGHDHELKDGDVVKIVARA